MNLPTLYKKSETGALVIWNISVEQNVITTRWGQEGGAFQETREVVTEGKNTGKKNATTPEQQALLEATSKHTKQQKARKYVTTREAALAGERSAFVTGGVDPMLAFPREKKPKALVFPCDTQPKLDGHRCLAEVEVTAADILVALWTRTRKPITSMPHIVEAIKRHFFNLVADGKLGVGKVWLDGELYFHDLARVPAEFLAKYENPKEARFQYISSLIRPQEPVEGHEKVEYHTYDVADLDHRWVEREEWRKLHLSDVALPIVLVPTRRAGTEEDLAAQEEADVAAGYEGLMARNLNGMYKGTRTPDLLKVKRFVDSEFEVLDVSATTREVTDSKGSRTMLYANFKCKLPGWTGPGDEAHEFDTTINGDQVEQRRLLSASLIGRLLTVKYQGLTADNKPRFPKGLRWREDL